MYYDVRYRRPCVGRLQFILGRLVKSYIWPRHLRVARFSGASVNAELCSGIVRIASCSEPTNGRPQALIFEWIKCVRFAFNLLALA